MVKMDRRRSNTLLYGIPQTITFRKETYYFFNEYLRLSSVKRDSKLALHQGYKVKLVKFRGAALIPGESTLLYTRPRILRSKID